MSETLAKTQWKQVLSDLKDRVGKESWQLWFQNTLIIRLDPEIAEIGVPNLVVSDWMRDQYSNDILASIERVLGFRPKVLKVSVNGHLFRQMRKHESQQRQAVPSKEAKPENTRVGDQVFHLNQRYTLDQLIVGPSNQVAFNCAIQVSQEPGSQFNPLFIHGRSGVGKTHLLQGVAREFLDRYPKFTTLYTTAEYFVNQFVLAVQRKKLEDFRERFRSVDVLIVDDLHFLTAKDASQNELLHTFNALEQKGKQVILASDAHPRDLSEFTNHLTTRFMQGMVAEIGLPPRQTRLAIIKSKLDGHRELFSNEVVDFLADHLECSVREIEGYVNQLKIMAGMSGERVSLPMARQAISDFLSTRGRLVDLPDIENVVIAHYGVTSQQLHGRSRKRPVSQARQACMYLSRRLTSYSLKEIGRFFGNKNHTTVVFSVQSIEQKMADDVRIRDEIEHLIQTLNER